MNAYTIDVFLNDNELGIEEQFESFSFCSPYDAARAYDLMFTFSELMNSEKYSQSKNHTGDISVILRKESDIIRSKMMFLDEDPEKQDSRASKIITF